MATAEELLAKLPQKQGTSPTRSVSADDLLAKLPPKNSDATPMMDAARQGGRMAVDTLKMPYQLGEKFNQGAEEIGSRVAESGGRYGVGPFTPMTSMIGVVAGPKAEAIASQFTPKLRSSKATDAISATQGMLSNFLSNPLNYVPLGEPSISQRKILEPRVNPDRVSAVESARRIGLPLTRPEQTGSKAGMGLENITEKAPFGSGPIQDFYGSRTKIIEKAKEDLINRFGTKEPPSSSGQSALLGMQGTIQPARQLGRQLYKKVPDVPIEPNNLAKSMSDLELEQIDIPKNIKLKIEKVVGAQVPSTITEETSPKLGQLTPLSQKAVPSFQKLNDLRNYLNSEIKARTTLSPGFGAETNPEGLALLRIKKALDQDISDYATKQTTPYGAMEASEFSTAFSRAKGFHGDLKNLMKNPLVRKISSDKTPASEIPGLIFDSGIPENVLTAKAALGDAGYQAAKEKFFTDLVTSNNIGTKLSKYDNEFLNSAFTKDELSALKDIDAAIRLTKETERLQGTHGSARSNVAAASIGSALTGLGTAPFSPHPVLQTIASLSVLGIPPVVARVLMSDAFRGGLRLGGARAGVVRAGLRTGLLGSELKKKETISQ